MMDINNIGYKVEYDSNKCLWSVSFVGKILKWHKTQGEAQDHLIDILETAEQRSWLKSTPSPAAQEKGV